MARTPQRFPGAALEDDSVQFEDRGSDVSVPGALWRRGDDLYGRDSSGKFNLRQSGGGGDLLRQAIFKSDGGLVYTNAGDVAIKESP